MKLNRSLRTDQKLKRYPLADTSGLKIRGTTLVELMVAIAVGSVILGVTVIASMTTALWFAALVNYVDMDAKSRNALDQMSLKIRQAGALTEFSPTHLKFTALGQTNSFLVYDWDAATGSLTEWKTGDTTTNTLLTDCDQLAFSLYNSSLTATTNLSQSKGLSVNWKCSRTIRGRKSTTEDMQQAVIVMRNKAI